MYQTSFVPGWMIGVPLLIAVGIWLWVFVGMPGIPEEHRDLEAENDRRKSRMLALIHLGCSYREAQNHLNNCDGCPDCDPMETVPRPVLTRASACGSCGVDLRDGYCWWCDDE